jgi:MoaA/NifB/PqqE/SkfB family radical SAM enzyme
MNLPDTICMLPWISVEASPMGTARPCCLAQEEITDANGMAYSLRDTTLETIYHSGYMQSLRQQFRQGQQPATCNRCWEEEAAGRDSKRIHSQVRLKELYQKIDWDNDKPNQLWFIDLKLGNICNLKCRICGSWSSSTFATEELQWLRRDEDRKDNHHYRMLRAGAWPRENPTFWSEIDQVSDQIQYIEFTGGEPFMIQEHFDLLNDLIARGIAGNIEIHYNTNGTQWPEQGEEIWRHFKTVEIAFSIDDVGSRFEYQRSNAVWIDVCNNIKRFQEMRNRRDNIRLQVCTTVNVFNVYYLETVANWINEQGFDFVYWNMMHEAYYFSISTLPDTAKREITEKLKSAKVDSKTQQEFDRIIDFMNRGVGLDGGILRMSIADLDRKRSQNLKDVEPEFAQLIKYELT